MSEEVKMDFSVSGPTSMYQSPLDTSSDFENQMIWTHVSASLSSGVATEHNVRCISGHIWGNIPKHEVLFVPLLGLLPGVLSFSWVRSRVCSFGSYSVGVVVIRLSLWIFEIANICDSLWEEGRLCSYINKIINLTALVFWKKFAWYLPSPSVVGLAGSLVTHLELWPPI